MVTATDALDHARPFVSALVDGAERRGGSRMAAYDAVARTIGVTSSWVRKLVGRQPIVLEAHEYLNIVAAYRSLCERIEAEAERERQLRAALIGDADAALKGLAGVVAGAPRQDRGATLDREESSR